jgi:hypothetical protein
MVNNYFSLSIFGVLCTKFIKGTKLHVSLPQLFNVFRRNFVSGQLKPDEQFNCRLPEFQETRYSYQISCKSIEMFDSYYEETGTVILH